MTVKVEAVAGGVEHNTILAVGLIGALVGVYLTYLNVLTGTQVFSFFGGLGAVCALMWGSETIKMLCSYGIGTGVPSAGMIAFGAGVIAMLLASKYGIAAPLVGLILAAVIGAILGYIANEILLMKIPVMIQAITELSIVGALTLMGFAAMNTGTFNLAKLMSSSFNVLGTPVGFYATFIGASFIAVVFLLGAIAIQHPFNATLGPGWKQDRMLMLAAECGFLSMITVAIISFAFISLGAAIVSFIVSLVGWGYTYMQYIQLSKRDAAMWLDAKPIVEPEGH
jgi:tetrahydromethanopterin S-methyltransferase subunit C